MNKTTLPLSPQQMVEFFKNKDEKLTIDYNKSLYNVKSPKFLLMYIANLGLTCDVDVVTDELLYEYLTLTEFTDIQNLQYIHANILYLGKYGEVLYDELLTYYSVDDMIRFIQANPTLIQTQMAFINSMPLFIDAHKGIGEDEPNKEHAKKSTDKLYDELGFSIISLFSLSDFLMSYLRLNIDIKDQIYFTRYFDEYMYGGKNLFGLFNNNMNSYMGLVQLVTDAEHDAEAKQVLDDLTNTMTNILHEYDQTA